MLRAECGGTILYCSCVPVLALHSSIHQPLSSQLCLQGNIMQMYIDAIHCRIQLQYALHLFIEFFCSSDSGSLLFKVLYEALGNWMLHLDSSTKGFGLLLYSEQNIYRFNQNVDVTRKISLMNQCSSTLPTLTCAPAIIKQISFSVSARSQPDVSPALHVFRLAA